MYKYNSDDMANLSIKRFTFNPFGENTYVIWTESKECAIIDPGMMTDSENIQLADFISQNSLTPTHLINTHQHIDHVAGNSFIESTYGIKSEGHPADTILAERVTEQAKMFGIVYNGKNLAIGKELNDGNTLKLGNLDLKVLHIPGHSKGHIAIYCEESNAIFVGDALFQMSIGRTDLPGGSFKELINSIETKLFTLPEDTVVYPGHGDTTTIAFEKAHNPYLL